MKYALSLILAVSAFAQTSALLPVPRQTPLNNSGGINVGGCVYTYTTGTTTPQSTYSNAGLSTANTNPIVLDGSGRMPAVYWNGTAIKVVYANKALGVCPASPGTTLWSQDPVTDSGLLLKSLLAATSNTSGSNGAALIGYQYPSSSTPRTVQTRLQDYVSFADFGITGSGDEHVKIQAAISAAGAASQRLLCGPGTYSIGSTTITIPTGITLYGTASERCVFTYSGTGVAIDGRGSSDFTLDNIKVITSNAAATAYAFGNNSRGANLTNLYGEGVNGATNTGTGLLFDGPSAGFSAHTVITGGYMLQYKYPWRWVSNGGGNVWTSVSASQLWLVCANVANVGIAGSIGLYMDGNAAAGIGSTWYGGTIESCAKPYQFDNGAKGIDIDIDMEQNTSDGTVGNGTSMHIRDQNVGRDYGISWNGATNRWWETLNYLGNNLRAAYYNFADTVWNQSGASAKWGFQRGTAAVAGTGSQAIVSGTYISGGSIAGAAAQTCTLTFIGGDGLGTATVALTGLNVIGSGTALTITAGGVYPISTASATLGNGTATCSGTAVVTAVVNTTEKYVVHADVSTDNSSGQNWVQTWANKVSYGTAAPVTGRWIVGDLVYNTAGSGVESWVCTATGTPGTWLGRGPYGIYLTGQTGVLVNTSVIENTDSVVHTYLLMPVMRIVTTDAAGSNTVTLKAGYTRLAGANPTLVNAMDATVINDSFNLNAGGTVTPAYPVMIPAGQTLVVFTTIGGAGTTYTYDLSVRAMLMQ
tara:strand:- start:126 stop:2396 length:2271 start_codon:yes stop_codon:yes gene_type:complete